MRQNEVAQGIELLSDIFRRYGELHLLDSTPSPGIFGYSITFYDRGFPRNTLALECSEEFLSDLPGTPDYEQQTQAYASALRFRMRNHSPKHFYCKSGIPIQIDIDWRFHTMYAADGAPRAARYLLVYISNLERGSVGKCRLVITTAQSWNYPAMNAIYLEKLIVNTVRNAVDRSEVQFAENGKEPTTIPELKLEPASQASVSRAEIEQFTLEKVFWLGFKQQDRDTLVWIADPWDAEYLGVESKSLKQAGQVLEARQMIELDQTAGELACSGRDLLRKAHEIETRSESRTGITSERSPSKATPNWDLFISHASEDKQGFVRPLAEALHAKGLKVWYDDFTLKMGDSLRESIDKGLANSRYGVVVLSPSFFAKNWPKMELNGLVAREVGGRKVILPIWHNVNRDDVCRYSPTLADRLAASSGAGTDAVIAKILEAMR